MRVDIAPNIDGNLDENIWEKSQKAINFVMLEPGDGTPEREAQRTVVQVLYDNTAIYIGATLYDDEPAMRI